MDRMKNTARTENYRLKPVDLVPLYNMMEYSSRMRINAADISRAALLVAYSWYSSNVIGTVMDKFLSLVRDGKYV